MKKVAVIVEGKGDVRAIPSLIAKIAVNFQLQVIATEPPIKAGEAKKLMRNGELERFLRLAASRPDVEEVILVLDLDDGCPVAFAADFNARANAVSAVTGKSTHICFCVREYETWFLANIDSLRSALPEYGIDDKASFPNATLIRGAKEALRAVCKTKGYKQMRDQLALTKKLDIKKLVLCDRLFRKLVKPITSKDYDEILMLCAENS